MHLSTVTAKGQTTVPHAIRMILKLMPSDKIVFVPDGSRVFITALHGNILDLAGCVRRKGKKAIHFAKLRESVKEQIVKEAAK